MIYSDVKGVTWADSAEEIAAFAGTVNSKLCDNCGLDFPHLHNTGNPRWPDEQLGMIAAVTEREHPIAQ